MTLNFGAGTTLNARPHPRVAVVSWQSQLREQWATALRSLVATVDEFQSTSEADWSEYDCVFTDQNPLSFEMRNLAGEHEPDRHETRWSQNFAAHLDVFVMLGLPNDSASGQLIGAWPERSQDENWSAGFPHHVLEMAGRTKGSYLTRVEGLSESLSWAVDQSIASVAKERSDHLVYKVLPAIDIGPDVEEPTTRPLLLGPSNVPLAMTWTRESGATVWAVPADTVDVMVLVREAFAEWNLRDSKRYPSIPDWDHDVRYRTAAERALHVELEAVEDEFEQVKAAHEAKVVGLLERLDEVERTDGDARRALLRADGDTLERAVKSALEDLRFAVQPMDEVNLVSKREDLRVTDPDIDGWIAICEVKGYTRGAGVDALRQVEHHAGLFARDEGKLPAKWVVVNAQRQQDPATREAPYVSRADDVGSLEETGGLVLDTRALFEALQLVESGRRGRSEVRVTLRDAVGVMIACPWPDEADAED